MSVHIRIATASDIDRIGAAYRSWNYSPGITPGDTIWLAETEHELIGAVRIVTEHGTLVLRGMRIAEQRRRQGIGSAMLRASADWLGARECYSVPYTHLIDFYGRIGFVEIAPALAPAFLAARLEDYRSRGLEVIIMFRPPA